VEEGSTRSEGWGGLSAGHVVSRSVRDSALMLDCTAGPEPGDPYAAPTHERPFLEAIARPPRRLRIALMLKDHRGVKLHPECLEAVQRAAKLRLGGGVRRCRAAFLYSAQLSRAGTLDGAALISNSFLVRCPRSRPQWRVSLFKSRRIKHLVVAATQSSLCTARCH
jgi:Asp-tRNA(Asn)/Glu-tRNA(Gln) amidotransferase A subunit family amidase